MRIFGGDKIAWLMEFLRADEEIPIEHNMVSKSIEGAQRKWKRITLTYAKVSYNMMTF